MWQESRVVKVILSFCMVGSVGQSTSASRVVDFEPNKAQLALLAT